MKCDIWLAVNTWVLDSHPSPPPGNGRYHVRRDCYFTCLRQYCHWITIHNVSVKFLKWLDWTKKSIIVCEENAFVPRTHLVQIVTCLNPLTMIGVKGYCKIWQFPGFFIWMAWMAGMLYLYLSFFFFGIFTIHCRSGRRWSFPQSWRDPEATADCFRLVVRHVLIQRCKPFTWRQVSWSFTRHAQVSH